MLVAKRRAKQVVEAGRVGRKPWVNIVDDYLWNSRVLNQQAEALEVEIFFTSNSGHANAVDLYQRFLLFAR